jgi:hypothetical protein
MSYFQLSAMKELTSQQQTQIIEYLARVAPNHILRASKLANDTSISADLAVEVMQKLVERKLAMQTYAIRCPECGLLLQRLGTIPEIENTCLCYGCDREVEITADDIEVFYTLINPPFVEGQQTSNPPEKAAALCCDSLAHLIRNKKIDFCAQFYSPEKHEQDKLEAAYYSIFNTNYTRKAKGDSLESLVGQMFSLCKHFCVSTKVHTETNQLDCFVRNTLFSSFCPISDISSFIIECKNEKDPPSVTYIQKLAGILLVQGKKFGIIASKHKPPKTYARYARELFLSQQIIIIAFDARDLHSIAVVHNNLLECIERKIEEIKTSPTSNLKKLGVFTS